MFEPRVPPKKTKEPSLDDLPPGHKEGILLGWAQIQAGQGIPIEEVEKKIRWAKEDDE